jgi:hypothetical protein
VAEVDDFEAVRHDPDPIRRGRRASALLMQYQQRAIELARLRRVAIEEAHRDHGMSFTEIAKALGVSKGRITQIKSGAPTAERAFFGVGPVAVGVPLRNGIDDRKRDYIDAADAAAQGQVEAILTGHTLASSRFSIGADMIDPPAGDVVVICGPKSAPIGADLLAKDPHLGMVRDGGRWWLEDRRTGRRYGSPTRDEPPEPADVAYLGRHREPGRIIVHIAGICSLGSLGAAHYLDANLADLWSELGDASFGMVVRCTYDGVEVTSVERLAGPYLW